MLADDMACDPRNPRPGNETLLKSPSSSCCFDSFSLFFLLSFQPLYSMMLISRSMSMATILKWITEDTKWAEYPPTQINYNLIR